MTIRIHLGAHKTATTELQRALRSVRDALGSDGLGYLGPRALRSEVSPLFHAIHKGEPDAWESCRRRFAGWLSRHEDHLISEENILGTTFRGAMFGKDNRIYPAASEALSQLIVLLGGGPVELFLSVRDPAQFVTSAYGQQLKTGTGIDIESYTGGVSVADLSWTDLVQRLLSVPGVARLICWRYEDYAALRPVILERMLGAERAAIVPAASWRNAGISDAAYRAFAEMVMEDLDRLSRICCNAPALCTPRQRACQRCARSVPVSMGARDATMRRTWRGSLRLRVSNCWRRMRVGNREAGAVRLEKRGAPVYLGRCNTRITMVNPAQFLSQVRAEAAKITWPTRREVVTTTIMVFIMATLAALFFFLVDIAIRTGLTALLGAVS